MRTTNKAAAAASTSITYLPFGAASRRRPPATNDSAGDSPSRSIHALSTLTQAKDKLARLQKIRVASFFRMKTTQRKTEQALASASNGGGSSTSRVARLLSAAVVSSRRHFQRQRQWRVPLPSFAKAAAIVPAAWKRKFDSVVTAFSRSAVVRGVMGLAQTMYRKLVGPTRADKRELELRAKEDRHRRAQTLVRVCISLAKFLALLGRARHRLTTRSFSGQFVSELLVNQQARVATLVSWSRKAKFAIAIQRCWRQLLGERIAHREGKARVLALLSRMTSHLERQELGQRERTVERQACCESAALAIILEGRKRLAARLVQRVWRGYRARKRVFAISDWRHKKAMRERIRARAKIAKEALLSPSREELAKRKQLDTRAASRKQRTPFLFPAGFHREQREAIYAAATWKAHSTQLAPLQLTAAPPRVSSLTRAKTQRVPFSKFDKMIAQRARVNMDNVWVAIPVAHREAAGPPRSRKTRILETQYDWVPASLLHRQHQPLTYAGDAAEAAE